MGLKIHIGCGSDIKDGYVNIDEFNPDADVQKPIQKLDYPENSVERIEGYMVLEHLTPFDAKAFIKKAHKMLEPGGTLILEVPDLEKVCRLILAFRDDGEYLNTGAFGVRGFFGEPTDHMTKGDYHKWGYTPGTLGQLLQEAGFSRWRVSDGVSHLYPLRDMRVEAVK